MGIFLKLARLIDALNERVGQLTFWLVLLSALVSAGNATMRYLFHYSSNAYLELQWYMFAVIFLWVAGYTLKHHGHVRVDVFYGRLSKRGQAWVDFLGALFFLLPFVILVIRLSWPLVMESIRIQEMSPDAGGLPRWPIKLAFLIGMFLLALQGLSELIQKLAILTGHLEAPEDKPSEEAV